MKDINKQCMRLTRDFKAALAMTEDDRAKPGRVVELWGEMMQLPASVFKGSSKNADQLIEAALKLLLQDPHRVAHLPADITIGLHRFLLTVYEGSHKSARRLLRERCLVFCTASLPLLEEAATQREDVRQLLHELRQVSARRPASSVASTPTPHPTPRRVCSTQQHSANRHPTPCPDPRPDPRPDPNTPAPSRTNAAHAHATARSNQHH